MKREGARLGRRERRLLEFVRFVSRPLPLGALLDEAPPRIAEILGADVASLYLVEPDRSAVVMRGTTGFPLGVRGKVRLRVGEGITGAAVADEVPIAAHHASEHDRYRAFPELDEERYPVFLAVPILAAEGALGALVVQRAADPGEAALPCFKPSEVRLATALTAPLSIAIQRASLHARDEPPARERRVGGGTRRATLLGTPVVSGRALGAVAALRRPATSPRAAASAGDAKLLGRAFDTAHKELSALYTKAIQRGLAREASFLTTYSLIASDARLRGRALELVGAGASLAKALSTVAREATRAAHGGPAGRGSERAASPEDEVFLRERARDIEDLCDALLMLARPDQRAALPTGAILAGDDLSVFDLVVTRRFKPVGIALSDRAVAEGAPGKARIPVLLELLGLPAVVGVKGLFEWATPGDIALVDGDHGLVVLNPSRSETAALRAEKRRDEPATPRGAPEHEAEARAERA